MLICQKTILEAMLEEKQEQYSKAAKVERACFILYERNQRFEFKEIGSVSPMKMQKSRSAPFAENNTNL